ncbi:hypothetical protein BDZ88DRAFT_434200 [Geranomyces variabilis]|nr:hypothetical protein BDZ88DRAFT_434200 [Geranomyces variabilis]KAJ3140336.1 hypothetical protein HDU90_008569 [Geranomyces variabilis]
MEDSLTTPEPQLHRRRSRSDSSSSWASDDFSPPQLSRARILGPSNTQLLFDLAPSSLPSPSTRTVHRYGDDDEEKEGLGECYEEEEEEEEDEEVAQALDEAFWASLRMTRRLGTAAAARQSAQASRDQDNGGTQSNRAFAALLSGASSTASFAAATTLAPFPCADEPLQDYADGMPAARTTFVPSPYVPFLPTLATSLPDFVSSIFSTSSASAHAYMQAAIFRSSFSARLELAQSCALDSNGVPVSGDVDWAYQARMDMEALEAAVDALANVAPLGR